jgi:4'-phosphopantetheinyl transferase
MFAFEPHAVHLWITNDEDIVDPALLARYERLLAPAEAERMRRFRLPRHRHQFLVARALLRHVLALYLDADPAALRFGVNRWGKPHLVAPATTVVPAFNLSHSEGRVVLALAADGEIGADVEAPLRDTAALDIAGHYFAPDEVAQLRDTPAPGQPGRFLDFWTLKEAYIKACGEGLAIPLDHFAYRLDDDRPIRIAFVPERDDDPDRWRFWQLRPASGHRIAVAHRHLLATQDRPLVVREAVPLDGHRPLHLPQTTSSPGVRETIPA